jgi:hypothetical protein
LTRGSVALFVVLLSALAGCAVPEIPPLAPRTAPHALAGVGCWELRPEGWNPGHLSGPRVVRLDTVRARENLHGDTLLLRLRVSPRDSMASRFSHWAPHARGDALYLHIGDGFTGVQLRLTVRNDSLRGRGYTTTDVVPSLRRVGRVRGVHVPCGAWQLDNEDNPPAA